MMPLIVLALLRDIKTIKYVMSFLCFDVFPLQPLIDLLPRKPVMLRVRDLFRILKTANLVMNSN